jgi:hypothetical protein
MLSSYAYRLTSVVLLAAATAAGWAMWPGSSSTDMVLPLTLASERDVVLSASTPAFILDDQLFAHQCGRLLGGGSSKRPSDLRLVPYAGGSCAERAQTSTLVVYNADLRLLWSLLTEAERDSIADTIRETSTWLRDSLRASLTESFFISEYRPLIREILRSGLERTLERRVVRDAFERAAGSLDRPALENLVAGIVPVAIEHFEAGLWTNLQALAGGWLGGPPSPGLTNLVSKVLNDPRVRRQLATDLPALAASPGMADAATVTAVEFIGVLLEDPRVPQLIQHLLTDRRITTMGVLGREALADGLPQKLLKLRSPTDHNPLSAYVVGLAMHGRSGNLLLMLTPGQYERLTPSAGSGTLLAKRE